MIRPRRDSKPGPLGQKSNALTTEPKSRLPDVVVRDWIYTQKVCMICFMQIFVTLCLDHVSSNGYAKFYQIYQKVQEIGPVLLFLEFEPLQNLDQSQMSFENLIGYSLSISMCMQNFITIFFTVQEKCLFHFFRIWSLAKPRPIKNVSSQSLGLDLVNINVYAKVYQNIPHSSRDRAIFTFSEFGIRQSLDRR